MMRTITAKSRANANASTSTTSSSTRRMPMTGGSNIMRLLVLMLVLQSFQPQTPSVVVVVTAFQVPIHAVQAHDRQRPTKAVGSGMSRFIGGSTGRSSIGGRSSTRVRVSTDTEEEKETTEVQPPQQQFVLQQLQQPQPSTDGYWDYWSTGYELVQAGIVGSLTGFLVAVFKLSIELVRRITYEQPALQFHPFLIALIPAVGGMVVGFLLLVGDSGSRNSKKDNNDWNGKAFPPGLRGTVQETDDNKNNNENFQLDFLRKQGASVATLGTGNSLGPEGPCVELGLNVARACTALNHRKAVTGIHSNEPPGTTSSSPPPHESQRQWNRVLLSCGAAAGVAAGFNAPIAGVFFALEIMQNTFTDVDQEAAAAALKKRLQLDNDGATANNNNNNNMLSNLPIMPIQASMTDSTTITPILISSVTSALLTHLLLGNHLILTLTEFDLATPLVELPLYLLLGALSGVVAFVFTYCAKVSQQIFAGEFAPLPESLKTTLQALPDPFKPVIGGLLCGAVGLVFPQILFFGYETLNALLSSDDGELSLPLILALMGVKTIMTAVAAGSGLVGGTFAPSLFLGGMLGCAFHEVANNVIESLNGVQMMVDATTSSSSSSEQLAAAAAAIMDPETIPQALESSMHIAGLPAYAMVGAASVLAALFRAPLTASLLLFEVTRNYDVILPLMASAGVGSIVGDILEDRLERRDEMERRDRDPVSWGDLSFPVDEQALLSNMENETSKKASAANGAVEKTD